MTYPEIKTAIIDITTSIKALSEEERCLLNAWIQNWEMDDWDRQMLLDAASGRLDFLGARC